jgi:hypothetical protein
MVGAGVASIILSVVSLSGFADAAGGDSMASPMSGVALATLLLGTLLLGTLVLLGLETAHVLGHRARLATR